MIKPEDLTIIEPLTSCTVDVAIAKLLGWMQGDIRHQYIPLELDGVSEEALKHMHSFEVSIWRFLTEQRENAQWVYKNAVELECQEELRNTYKQKITRVDEVVIKAKSYQRDIDDELRKGDESALQVDESASEASGVNHISLTSLDQWALKKYGISVLDYSKSKVIENAKDQTSDVPVPVPVPVPDIDVEESDVKSGLSKTIANNLYITLALLVEDRMKGRGGKFHHSDERLKVYHVVTDIMGLALDAQKNTNLPGQKRRTLQAHVERALAVKRDALK